jgi:GT2 family glycosyltransferase
MNTGAAEARADRILFLHADTRLPQGAVEKIIDTLDDERYVAGAFGLEIDSQRWIFKHIAAWAGRRSHKNRIPYGDQAIFIDKDYFDKIGRFRDIPLMEDVDLMRRIKRAGDEICILKERILTSPRRWEAEGPVFTTVRNQILVSLFYLGAKPHTLVRFYKLCSGK